MRMQMMRKLRCLAWFPCLLAFLLLPGAVHAKEYACDVTIPATVQVSGDRIPSGEVYEVVMEAITKDAPVAENMTQKVLNSGTVSFGQIHYTIPGDYQYEIYQKSGSTDRFTYDKTVYTVTVRVQNDAEGGLFAEFFCRKRLCPRGDRLLRRRPERPGCHGAVRLCGLPGGCRARSKGPRRLPVSPARRRRCRSRCGRAHPAHRRPLARCR